MWCVTATAPLFAQVKDPGKAPPPIQDNSFLVEEAYNQESGVVQHITTFQVRRGSSDFDASFTQEWPVGSVKHQLSYDVPLSRANSRTGVGDIGVNYRYQAVGDAEARLAISPRISLTLPTGDWKHSRGNGAIGIEAAIPLSYVISPLLVTHFDVSAGVTPSARNSLGERATTAGWSTAGSIILTASNRVQPMLEAVYSIGDEVIGRDRIASRESLLISPGMRAAFNFSSGLQIVPGVAFPFGAGPSDGERGVFFYLSLEHPFNDQGRPEN